MRRLRWIWVCASIAAMMSATTAFAQEAAILAGEGAGFSTWMAFVLCVALFCAPAFINERRTHQT